MHGSDRASLGLKDPTLPSRMFYPHVRSFNLPAPMLQLQGIHALRGPCHTPRAPCHPFACLGPTPICQLGEQAV